LIFKDSETGKDYDPELTFINKNEGTIQVEFVEYGHKKNALRGVPVRYIDNKNGTKIPVTTIYDLTMAQYGVGRGLPGEYPTSYDDKLLPILLLGKKFLQESDQKLYCKLHENGQVQLKKQKVNVW
jgi:nitrate reductase alpha subunit